MDDNVANLILERLTRIDRRIGRIEDDMAVLKRRFDEVVEANNTAIGWAGFALANHETLARRLDEFRGRVAKLEENAG